MGERCAPAALDRLAPKQSATWPAAWQRPRPDAENFGGEVSFEPPFTSFDHFVGAGEQRKRRGDAERPYTLVTRALASWRTGPATLHSTLDHLAKDRLDVCLSKRSQRLRANISKGAAAQSKRSHGNIIRCLNNRNDIVLA